MSTSPQHPSKSANPDLCFVRLICLCAYQVDSTARRFTLQQREGLEHPLSLALARNYNGLMPPGDVEAFRAGLQLLTQDHSLAKVSAECSVTNTKC